MKKSAKPQKNLHKKQKRKRNKLSQPLRVEEPDKIQLITSRSINSRLWFIRNSYLQERICAFLAKYAQKYGAKVYNFQLVGNHYHLEIQFPYANTSAFMRDFNARITEAVKMLVPSYGEGSLFQRRYSTQYLADEGTAIQCFMYIAHQCISSKLCRSLKEYPEKTHTDDAIRGIVRSYRYFNHFEYNKAKKSDPDINREDFWEYYDLEFSRLPGHHELTDEEYIETMYSLLAEHRSQLLKKLEESGARFLGKKALLKVVVGSEPANTKKGGRIPRVLGLCQHAKRQCLEFYLDCVEKYKRASEKFRSGELNTVFPPRTYRPPGNTMLV